MKPRKEIARQLQRINNLIGYKRRVWIVGDGRSGTTWLQEVLNIRKDFRTMFEPLHHYFFDEVPDDRLVYLRPDDQSPEMYNLVRSVFSGAYIHKRVSKPDLRLYRALLVKDIFSHLYVKWVKVNFPDIRVVILIRNPYDVAVSKMRLNTWDWIDEPALWLQDRKLVADHLAPIEDLIGSTKSTFGKFVLGWSIRHYVLFRQIEPGDADIVFYEDLVRKDNSQLDRLFQQFLDISFGNLAESELQKIRMPSRMFVPAHGNGQLRGKDDIIRNLEDWELDEAEMALNAFGLNKLYTDNKRPSAEELKWIIHKEKVNSIQ